jgi:hypothetical protein
MHAAAVTVLTVLMSSTPAPVATPDGSVLAEDPVALTDIAAPWRRLPTTYSAAPQGAGGWSLSTGGSLLLIAPMGDARLAVGLTDFLDLQIEASSAFYVNLGSLGVRAAVYGDSRFSVSFELGMEVFWALLDARPFVRSGVALAAVPGFLGSVDFGSSALTVGVDFPTHFFAATDGWAGTGMMLASIRPHAAVEFAMGPAITGYIRAQVYCAIDGNHERPFDFAPRLSTGLTF